MGWVWTDENDDVKSSPSKYVNEDRCSTRKIMKSKCNTEEVEPGKFIRKCEKTEEIIKECLGRFYVSWLAFVTLLYCTWTCIHRKKNAPSEVVQSNKEYTEEDITDEVTNGSFSSQLPELAPFDFPGLRNDMEAIERHLFGGLSRFFDAAEEMKSGFFEIISPNLHDRESSSSSTRRSIPIQGQPDKLPTPKSSTLDSSGIDIAGLARDV